MASETIIQNEARFKQVMEAYFNSWLQLQRMTVEEKINLSRLVAKRFKNLELTTFQAIINKIMEDYSDWPPQNLQGAIADYLQRGGTKKLDYQQGIINQDWAVIEKWCSGGKSRAYLDESLSEHGKQAFNEFSHRLNAKPTHYTLQLIGDEFKNYMVTIIDLHPQSLTHAQIQLSKPAIELKKSPPKITDKANPLYGIENTRGGHVRPASESIDAVRKKLKAKARGLK